MPNNIEPKDNRPDWQKSKPYLKFKNEKSYDWAISFVEFTNVYTIYEASYTDGGPNDEQIEVWWDGMVTYETEQEWNENVDCIRQYVEAYKTLPSNQ